MPWATDPESRRRNTQTYGNPEYRTNRKRALARTGGRCEQCGSTRRVQVDHVLPVSQGGGHQLSNLQVLCQPCHHTKTAAQPDGGGYRNPSSGGSKSKGDPEPAPWTDW